MGISVHTAAGADYVAYNRQLTFSGFASTIVVITILDDDLGETVENFFVSLSLITTSSNILVDPDQATFNIFDDDGMTSIIH